MLTKLKTIDILKDFHKITGARVSLHDLDFNEIAAFPSNLSPFCSKVQQKESVKLKCHHADELAFEKVRASGTAYTYKCHCGLIETVAPIYNYGALTGYFMMGQICDDEVSAVDNIKRLSKNYFETQNELETACKNIPIIKADMMESYINILEIIAEYMTNTNRLTAKDRDLALGIKSYVHKFYQKKLTVKLLCETFGCSRTTLMNTFSDRFGITLGEYITQYRLEKAEKMLVVGEKSVKSVAAECGFSDQNYFTKVFRQKHGITPTEYRFKGNN